jgi:hypothetical protein
MKKRMLIAEIGAELERARAKHPDRFHSAHEGYAVIQEELDELWNEIKHQQVSRMRMKAEAIQVAAMAIRFIEDLLEEQE